MLGFSIGLRALQTSQQALDVLGQNLTNFATEGYTRKDINLAATSPVQVPGLGSVGTGVHVRDIRRVQNGLLEDRLRGQQHLLGQARAESQLFGLLEGYLAEPGASGLTAQLDTFFGDLSTLTAIPTDSSARGGFLRDAESLAFRFRQLAGELDTVAEDAQRTLQDSVKQINSLAEQIAAVNAQLSQSAGGGQPSSDLLDRQGALLLELSQFVDFQSVERNQGTVDVLVDGRLLVSGDRAAQIESQRPGDGSITLRLAGDKDALTVRGGQIKGLLRIAEEVIPARLAELDEIARALVLETNRLHSTGVSALGPATSVTAGVSLASLSSAQSPETLALSNLDFGFPLQAGELLVNITNQNTGAVEQSLVTIDPQTMSMQSVVDQLNQIPHLSAGLDSVGRLRLNAAAGYGFDFSPRLDPNPDAVGAFGGAAASLVGGNEPYGLNAGDQLTVAVNGAAPQTVTFSAGDFAVPGKATAAEVAAVIQAQTTNVSAAAVDGRLVLQSTTSGSTSSLLIGDATGSPSTSLGLSTSLEQGAATGVKVELAGFPEDSNVTGKLTVRATGDGTIGATSGLQVEVVDAQGTLIATLDVGAGYTPGEPLEVVPGVSLSLSAGEVSQTAGDSFSFRLTDDADTADFLVALEIGAFFTGSDARSIGVAGDVLADTRLIAGSRNGAVGDSSNFLHMLGLQGRGVGSLQGSSLNDALGELVAGVGLDSQGATSTEQSQELLFQSLQARREQISGVNIDEEILKLTQMEQLYQVASRYLQTIQQVSDTLLTLV